MTGSLIKLHALTKHNRYLITSNPEMDSFKGVFKRSNNYSFEYINIECNGTKYFGQKLTFTIPKKAHFVQETILRIKLPALTLPSGSTYINWTNSLGHALIDKIELSIGDYIVDTQDGLFYEILDELTNIKNYQKTNSLIRKFESPVLLTTSTSTNEEYLYIPLKFWYTESLSNALPLYLLNYHSIKINVYLKEFQDCVIYDGVVTPDEKELISVDLTCKFIYLDNEELQLINNFVKQENDARTFIITQTQSFKAIDNISSNKDITMNLNSLNHPVLELLLVFIEQDSIENNDYFNFGQRILTPYTDKVPLIKTLKFDIDGNQLFYDQDESFYRKVLQYNHHSKVSDKLIYTIPFSQEPENYSKYTGSLNFSAIDQPLLYIKAENGISLSFPFIYAINYNIATIKNGLFGIQFLC